MNTESAKVDILKTGICVLGFGIGLLLQQDQNQILKFKDKRMSPHILSHSLTLTTPFVGALYPPPPSLD